MSSFSEAGDILASAFEEIKGVEATYRLRDGTTIDVVVWSGKTDAVGTDGVWLADARIVDWICQKTQLTLNAQLFEPELGHSITIGSERFDVISPDANMPVFAESGTDRNLFRIHTKKQS